MKPMIEEMIVQTNHKRRKLTIVVKKTMEDNIEFSQRRVLDQKPK